MTDLSRRSFLRGAMTVAAATIVSVALADAGIPRIVGDGIHDDTLGLQAALDGKPFIADDFVFSSADGVVIENGHFAISDTLHIGRTGTRATIRHCVFDGELLEERVALKFERSTQ